MIVRGTRMFSGRLFAGRLWGPLAANQVVSVAPPRARRYRQDEPAVAPRSRRNTDADELLFLFRR